MTKQIYTAPIIDDLLARAQSSPEYIDFETYKELKLLVNEINKIKIQGDDELRKLWIVAERGNITDFGNYKEMLELDEVETKEDFVELWKYYYPNKVKWYQFTYATYKGIVYLYIDNKLTFQFSAKKPTEQESINSVELSKWLIKNLTQIVQKLTIDTTEYNDYIEKMLPFNKRIGKIKRSDYWRIFPETKKTIVGNLELSDFMQLEEIVQQSNNKKSSLIIEKMSANDFLYYCSIGYRAIDTLVEAIKDKSPLELYDLLADGRDCGLKTINQESYQAFENWYLNDSHCGGHPWEILRGGNSTHISLMVEHIKEQGWILHLDGSSSIRVNETVNIALALYKNSIPFFLRRATAIREMINGTDFIGIVPDLVTPRYCHSMFPDSDQIIDFMNIDNENTKEVINLANWYPIENIELK